jgi:hypothetical protein
LDLAKIPFLYFIKVYTLVLGTVVFVCVFLSSFLVLFQPIFWGAYISFFIQYLSVNTRIFCFQYYFSNSFNLQNIITGLTFFVNLLALFIISKLEKNIFFIIGFFVGYFLNLIFVLWISLYYSKK